MRFHVLTDDYSPVTKNVTQAYAENCARHALKRMPAGSDVLICYTKGEFATDKPLYLHARYTRLAHFVT
jgi:hypothetical protein